MEPEQPSPSSSVVLIGKPSQGSNTSGGLNKSRPKFVLSDDQIADLKKAFDVLDVKCTGIIHEQEVKVAFRCLGSEPKKEDMQRMMYAVDPELTGRISFNDFVQVMTMRMLEKDSTEDIRKQFRLFDNDDKGKITFEDLQRVAKELGKNMNEEELREMFDEADVNKDGEVSEEDFLRVVKDTSLL